MSNQWIDMTHTSTCIPNKVKNAFSVVLQIFKGRVMQT